MPIHALQPPVVLASHFNDNEFQKSQAYGKDKAKFSIFSGLFGQLPGSAMIHYGFYAWAWGTAGHFLARYGYGPQYEVSFVIIKRCLSAMSLRYTNKCSTWITQSIAFAVILYFASFILTLLLSLYENFVLEEKYGFNKTTPSLCLVDILKSWGLGFTLGAPFFGCFPIRVQVGGRSICSLADGFLVVISIDNGLPVPNSHPAFLQQSLPPQGWRPTHPY